MIAPDAVDPLRFKLQKSITCFIACINRQKVSDKPFLLNDYSDANQIAKELEVFRQKEMERKVSYDKFSSNLTIFLDRAKLGDSNKQHSNKHINGA